MEKTVRLFAQLSKVDEAKREVWGIATAEVVDKEGEIFDYESSKPYFKSWSEEISKATDGKSLGNVREMHEPSAVGKLIDLTFDDELKQIRVAAKIIDDPAWQKCLQGVYTGFSIGGRYVKAWKDAEFLRFTAEPAEISVVDNPCVPTAHFTAVKADGTCEIRKFAPLKKDMYSVANLAALLQSAVYLQMDAQYEAEYEADDSEIPTELKQWVKDGAAILARMTEEELNELTARMKAVRDKLGKAGAKHSAETKAHHAAINKCMGKIAKAAADAQEHCDALMGKDMEDAAMPAGVTKDSPGTAEIQTGVTNMLEATEKATLEKAQTDSASALGKITAMESQIAGLATKDEVNKGFEQIMQVLNKFVEKMAGDPAGAQKVARTGVPGTVTVTKENDAQIAEKAEPTEAELAKMTPEQRSQHAFVKAMSGQPVQITEYPGHFRGAVAK